MTYFIEIENNRGVLIKICEWPKIQTVKSYRLSFKIKVDLTRQKQNGNKTGITKFYVSSDKKFE